MLRNAVITTILVSLAACTAAPGEDALAEPSTEHLTSELQESRPNQMPASPPEPTDPDKQPEGPAYRITADGIAGLPSSDGKTFVNLDEYLAHLETKGHIDRPFWERLKDGTYRWNTGRGMQFREPKIATRKELMQQYGFAELP